MIKLDRYSLDEPKREMYAEEVDLNGVVNREFYYTRGRSFIARTFQLRSIDRLLENAGFEDYHNHHKIATILDWAAGIDVEFPHHRRYYNGKGNDFGTRVEIKPTLVWVHSSWGFYGSKQVAEGLTIEVGKKGSFEDYVQTCNLFRKFFGLKKRVIRGK